MFAIEIPYYMLSDVLPTAYKWKYIFGKFNLKASRTHFHEISEYNFWVLFKMHLNLSKKKLNVWGFKYILRFHGGHFLDRIICYKTGSMRLILLYYYTCDFDFCTKFVPTCTGLRLSIEKNSQNANDVVTIFCTQKYTHAFEKWTL